MLRYIYLLVTIYYINSTLCYDYLNDDSSDGWAREDESYGVSSGLKRLRSSGGNTNRQQADSEPMAKFDVADFMQGYDNAVEDYERYTNPHRKRQNLKESDIGNFENVYNSNSKDNRAGNLAYSVEDLKSGAGDDAHAMKTSTDAVFDKNFDYSFAADKDLSRQKSKETSNQYRYDLSRTMYKPDEIGRNQVIHHHQKKGVLKNIRFPFFSRNKSSTMATTKDRKRKTSKNSRVEKSKMLNKVNGRVENDAKQNTYTRRQPEDFLYKNKRSYFESVCPDCKKRYASNLTSYKQSRHISDKLVHNSRQFFQNQVLDRGSGHDEKESTQLPEGGRRRREFIEDKQRQLKELEEVAKKIESVTVRAQSTDYFMPPVFPSSSQT